MKPLITLIFVIFASLVLIACGGGTTATTRVETTNHAPVISGKPVASVDEGVNYSFTPISSDSDNDSLRFSVTNTPAWATFHPDSGTISGTPGFDDAGKYDGISISVTDGTATAHLPVFSITVNNTNRAPSISGSPNTTVQIESPYHFQPTADDPDGDTLSYTISHIPNWANFDTTTGILSGTPASTDIGVYTNIIISVSDGSSTLSLASFAITVNSDALNTSASIYVDMLIGPDYCSNYDVSSRSCNSAGQEEAYRTLSGAASAAVAGDIVELRAGTYNEQLLPQNSGTETNPITYRNYNKEAAIISGASLSPAVDISNRSYLILDGLEISNVRRWMYALSSHHNIIRANVFSGANDPGGSSKTGLYFQEATFNRILDNVIDDSTQDNISLIKSDNNLIEGNTITNAAHTLWAIKCGNRNILRSNYFHNSAQKIGEVYDCENVGFDHQIYVQDSTKYNVIESNVFAKTSTYYSPSGGNGIQYAGQNGIIRQNIFYNNNVGIGLKYYSPEALHNKHNRIFNNTFYKNYCGGISTSSPASPNFTDNIFVNNILSTNVECDGIKPYQLVYRDSLSGFQLVTNNLWSGTPLDSVIGAWQGSGNTLQWYETNYPDVFSMNIEKNPDFKNESTFNFELNPGSQMIDTGRFLTRTSTSGTGNIIPVIDASYFHNGFGIEGVTGDEIQLEGSSDTYIILDIDYSQNTITLDKNANWSADQGISLNYNGNAPDMGALESN